MQPGEHLRRATRLGFAVCLLAVAVAIPRVARAESTFTAELDRQQISQDDSVSLKMTVKSDGNSRASAPQFKAPDFEVVNEYHGTFVESYYENGQFGMRNNQQLTKVLRPTKSGSLKITGLRVDADGKTLTAPDLTVMVGAGGGGTPPPRGYGGGGVGLRGSGKTALPIFVRAEIDKDKAYKGEQVVVSYYLYRRLRVFNIQVEKYPVLNGFLREDLEIPVLGPRLDNERVVLDGAMFERSLLARYAAYPLQEGKLKLDSMALKYNYYPAASGSQGGGFGGDDDEDPFTNFFRQMAPRSGQARADQLAIEVLPLPTDGRPASFTGGVGDFNISARVDKTEVKANEAVMVTVVVEGRGNVAAIGEPKTKWPDGVELYDSKGNARAGHAGVGEKTFEFLLIPRTPGKLQLPAIEMSFFDPSRRAFSTKSSERFEINVLPAAPGAAPTNAPAEARPSSAGASKAAAAAADGASKALTAMVDAATRYRREILWVLGLGILLVAGIAGRDFARKRRALAESRVDRRARDISRSWGDLHAAGGVAGNAPFAQVSAAYEALANTLLDSISHRFGILARAMPRHELRQALVAERGLPEAAWKRVEKLLEFAETVRFAATAGAVSELQARSRLAESVAEARELATLVAQADALAGAHSPDREPGA